MSSIDCWTKTSRFLPRASPGASSANFGELPVQGESPKEAKAKNGIWSWSEDAGECIVGQDYLETATYDKANEIYS